MVSLEEQVKQFGLVRANISETLGVEEAARFVSKALFVISVGSNDVFDYLSGKSGIHLGTLEFMGYLQQNYYVIIRVRKYLRIYHTLVFSYIFHFI